MEEISKQEYWQEVASIADEAMKEAKGNEDEAQEYIWQTVDGHQWVIYYYYHDQVLKHTANEDAYFDTCGPVEVKDRGDYDNLMMTMAFYALYQDCINELSDLDPEDYQEDEEAEGEEETTTEGDR